MLGLLDTPESRKFVAIETIVSVAISSLIPTAIIWALRLPGPRAIWGVPGLEVMVMQATLACIVLMTVILTLIIRKRAKLGHTPPGDWGWRAPPRMLIVLKWLPARAAIFALVMLVVLGTVTTLLFSLVPLLPFSAGGFVIFNLVFGAVMGLLAAPVIVRAALADVGGEGAQP